MAIYIGLQKVGEDAQAVWYRFGPDEQTTGVLRLLKATGEVDEIERLPTPQYSAYFQRAAVKVRQHWTAGSFPDRTVYAA